MPTSLTVTHLVRRFGPVGGMENYVWKLAHQCVAYGVRVRVICEVVDDSVDAAIEIVQVRPASSRPRWRAMREFQQRVEAVLATDRASFGIVHSHERCLSHQVTTFHGPPMGHLHAAPWYRRWSTRVRQWLAMEAEELLADHVQVVCPVSGKIQSALEHLYPSLRDRCVQVAWPGVDAPKALRNDRQHRLVFVGKEWKRKGLDRAIALIEALSVSDPRYTLTVIGVNPSEVPRAWLKVSNVIWAGWMQSVPYGDFDVLVHPARQEPFGMVVLEARAAGLACVISDAVGAAECPLTAVSVIPGDAPVETWVRAVEALITEPIHPERSRGWDRVAKQYLEEIYPQVNHVTGIDTDL